MTEKTNRVPQKHVLTIQGVARALGEVPRYALVKALKKKLPELSQKTIMDYVLSSVNEGILEKIGMNYRVKDGT